jgi:hypothetical protein
VGNMLNATLTNNLVQRKDRTVDSLKPEDLLLKSSNTCYVSETYGNGEPRELIKIEYGKDETEYHAHYGPGVSIVLDGDAVARAIDAYLVALGVHVEGSRTITVNGKLIDRGHVYVDPSGYVITPEGYKMSGRGPGK